MTKAMRFALALAVAVLGLAGFAGTASAQTATCNNAPGANSQEDTCVNSGDSDAEADQEGSASSGDGVAGQVAGVVSAGDASVDATNRSDDVSVTTGDATATNEADVLTNTGVFSVSGGTAPLAVCNNTAATGNTQGDTCVNSGDADAAADQAADAASGDGVGGQVIGVVTSAGGSADLVLDNESTDVDVETGESTVFNDLGGTVSADALVFKVV